MKIACVGGGGFIGHHLALRLKELGHDPLVVDFLGVNNLGSALERKGTHGWNDYYLRMLHERFDRLHAAGVRYENVDARGYHFLSRCLGSFKPDIIIHLAAVAHITVTKLDQHLAFEHSILTLKNDLDVAIAVGCQRFIYFSSSTIYGNFKTPVVDEETPADPDTTYGAFKLIGELLVQAWRKDKGLDYTIIRPQALYGPRCVSRRVTQVFLENALSGLPLRIDGDGSAQHDFTYIDDLVDGVVAVLDHMEASRNETFCITAGDARSLADLARIVQALVPGRSMFGPPDPDKPSRGTMSVAKAASLLSWTPRVSLEEGMARYSRFYEEFLDGCKGAFVGRGHTGT